MIDSPPVDPTSKGKARRPTRNVAKEIAPTTATIAAMEPNR